MGVVNVQLEELQKSLDMRRVAEERQTRSRLIVLSLSPNSRRKKCVSRKLVTGYYRGRWRPDLPCSPDESILDKIIQISERKKD